MLEPHEIAAGLTFTPGYIVLGNKRERVRQLGNAVNGGRGDLVTCGGESRGS
jgi:DNA (cytosine-5)-methyltransferase 1